MLARMRGRRWACLTRRSSTPRFDDELDAESDRCRLAPHRSLLHTATRAPLPLSPSTARLARSAPPPRHPRTVLVFQILVAGTVVVERRARFSRLCSGGRPRDRARLRVGPLLAVVAVAAVLLRTAPWLPVFSAATSDLAYVLLRRVDDAAAAGDGNGGRGRGGDGDGWCAARRWHRGQHAVGHHELSPRARRAAQACGGGEAEAVRVSRCGAPSPHPRTPARLITDH